MYEKRSMGHCVDGAARSGDIGSALRARPAQRTGSRQHHQHQLLLAVGLTAG